MQNIAHLDDVDFDIPRQNLVVNLKIGRTLRYPEAGLLIGDHYLSIAISDRVVYLNHDSVSSLVVLDDDAEEE